MLQPNNIEVLEELIATTTKQLLQLRALHRSLHRPVEQDVQALRAMAERHGFDLSIEPNYERFRRDKLVLSSTDYGDFRWVAERSGLEPESDPFDADDIWQRGYLDTATQGSPLHAVIRDALVSMTKEFPCWPEYRWPFEAQTAEDEDDGEDA